MNLLCEGGDQRGEILPAAWARSHRGVRMSVTGGPLCPQHDGGADGTGLCWGMWGSEPTLPSLSTWGVFFSPSRSRVAGGASPLPALWV